MNKLRRPTLWLAIVFAAGIMLMPARGAAISKQDPWSDPPMLGDPDVGGDIPTKRAPSMRDRDGLPYPILTYLFARFGVHLPPTLPNITRMRTNLHD